MTKSHAAGEIQRFHRRSWKFQQTFLTPLKDLPHFIATILSAFPLKAASITIKQIGFEPKHLLALLATHSIPAQNYQNITLTTIAPAEIAPLLEATLSDWIDFLFVPVPSPFAIYADHDEYTTFFANSRSNLNRVITPLMEQGFKAIPDYTRNV